MVLNRVPSFDRTGGGGSPKIPLLCKEGRGEVEKGPSLGMTLPLLASPYKGEGSEGRSPYKGEEYGRGSASPYKREEIEP